MRAVVCLHYVQAATSYEDRSTCTALQAKQEQGIGLHYQEQIRTDTSV